MSRTRKTRQVSQKKVLDEFAATVAKAQRPDKSNKTLEARKAYDAFSNAMARLGVNTSNLLEATEYLMTRLTRNYQLMNTLYRENWIVGKIIDTKAGDMVKNWYEFNSEISPDLMKRLKKMERKTRVKARLLEALKWGDLYGGSAAVILIDGQEDMLDQPLDLDSVMPGTFRGLLVLDRWSGITPGIKVVTDIHDVDFGLPKMYTVTPEDGDSFDIHHSRVLRFTGRDLPFWEKLGEMHWGASELERVYQELVKRDNTSYNIASLIFLANLRVLKMADMGQMLGTGNIQAQRDLYNTIQAQNWLMSNMGLQILDKEDDFVTHQYTFSGINDIYTSFMLDVCGASEIPMTRLFGRTMTGLGQSNEGDEQIYYDMIGQRQEEKLTPVMDKLLPIMCMSTWGFVPDDMDYEWNPVQEASDEDKAELTSKYVTAVNDTYVSGIIGRKTALKELKQLSDITGAFSNITDEDIEAASNEPSAGEMPNIPDPSSVLNTSALEQTQDQVRNLEESVMYLDSALRARDAEYEEEFDGGAGSGNFQHAGRPGQIGGSQATGTPFDTPAIVKARSEQKKQKSTHLINTPERVAMRQRIEQELYGTGARKKERKAVFVMGLPGSGKSTISDPIAEEMGAFIVDPDMAKEKIPEFNGGKNAGAVHQESSDISANTFNTAVGNGDNIVFPLVGRNPNKIRKLNKLLKQQGYSTQLVMVDVNPESAAQRAIKRWEHTGRFVDPDYVYNRVGIRPRNNYEVLKKEGEFDGYAKYTNEVPLGQKPRRID